MKESKVDLVSVIVPIYRVENYLKKCLNSIMMQTYRKLEIILVDDGSPDKCGEICDEMAKMDERIKVLHKKNGGLSDARNEGMKIATGEYVIFIDSDDYISNNMIKEMYNAAIVNSADIVVCGYKEVYTDKPEKSHKFNVKDGKIILSGEEATKRLMTYLEPEMVVAWNKLEKRSLWENIEFPFGKQHEDDFTTYKILYKANKVVLMEKPLYFYMQRNNSIIGVGFNEKSVHKIEAYKEAQEFFKKKDKVLYHRAINIVQIMNRRCCEEAKQSSYANKEEIIKRLKKEGRHFYLKNFYKMKRSIKWHLNTILFYFQ